MHEYACVVCVHRIVRVGVCGGQRSGLGVFLYYIPPCLCGTGSLTEPGARCLQLDGQRGPRICTSSPGPQGCWTSEIKTSYLHIKLLAH